MRIIAKKALRDFWEQYPDVQEPLEAWYYETLKADWSNPQQIKNQFRNASIIADNRVIFNIKGNDYRLIVKINYPYRVVYIRFIGTHKQYDAIEANKI
ncbi:MAG: type II toxin-antitoxin system HigB family toxin [Methylococcaceae bacterium]|jgi:mRNA interferase HigB